MENLRAKLESEVISCKWRDIADFLLKTDVLLIDVKLSLVDVAMAFANDQVDLVKNWLDAGEVLRLSQREGDQIADEVSDFRMLVVTPFALIQRVQ